MFLLLKQSEKCSCDKILAKPANILFMRGFSFWRLFFSVWSFSFCLIGCCRLNVGISGFFCMMKLFCMFWLIQIVSSLYRPFFFYLVDFWGYYRHSLPCTVYKMKPRTPGFFLWWNESLFSHEHSRFFKKNRQMDWKIYHNFSPYFLIFPFFVKTIAFVTQYGFSDINCAFSFTGCTKQSSLFECVVVLLEKQIDLFPTFQVNSLFGHFFSFELRLLVFCFQLLWQKHW